VVLGVVLRRRGKEALMLDVVLRRRGKEALMLDVARNTGRNMVAI
jgi:hypothetical protein